MTELKQDVNRIVEQEYQRAAKKFGTVNASDHESYAVIKEEMEEASEDFNKIFTSLENFWGCVKANEFDGVKVAQLENIQSFALFAACELVQVSAMAYKARRTIEIRRGE